MTSTKNPDKIKKLPALICLIAIITLIIDYGFGRIESSKAVMHAIYLLTLISSTIAIIVRYFFQISHPRLKVIPFDLLFIAFFSIIILAFFDFHFEKFKSPYLLHIAVLIACIREFSTVQIPVKTAKLNPAQVFVFSFLLIIVTGTLLLLLPNATHQGISLLDALFTSTSAVCVTGLVVVDTGTYFTRFGQIILLILIQTGGLGIMTFSSYFSYFFRGGTSYQNQIQLSEILNSKRISDVINTLKYILFVTFAIELSGAALVFINLEKTLIPEFSERVFFSIFHSVSAFCNAGFSTLQNSFFESGFAKNYSLHSIIAGLFIMGGIGFPILFNFLRYLRYTVVKWYAKLFKKRKDIYLPWIININTRIVLVMTFFLILTGTLVFYILEYNNALSGHTGPGKIVTAFFGAVTPRTAGFNSVDTATLRYPTLLFIMLLMWIGASPGSTGGGIKTSTFAVAILNIIGLVSGRNRLEIWGREISGISNKRAFGIVILSLISIFISIFAIVLLDPRVNLLSISFECVSAFSTVGLSRGITASLSMGSKLVLILTMFIGRISTLTLFIALFSKFGPSHLNYKYPSDDILIN
ncbi:MAG: ATPase [Bacteroidia bacterium]|nr:potassium transporter TrkG [Bacteroidales bacterium]NCD40600.1 ATPase [Bacteroidia bacterium]HPE86560.1 potassium transporter TrkG [Bacteroidales bacterium]